MAKRTTERDDPDARPLQEGDDGQEWHVVAEGPGRRLEAMLSLRLDPDTAAAVRRAARLQGVTQSEFVRRAARAAADELLNHTPAPTIKREAVPPVVVLGTTPSASTAGPVPASTGLLRPPEYPLTVG